MEWEELDLNNKKIDKDIDAELATGLARFSHCETDKEMEQLANISSGMPVIAGALRMIDKRMSELIGKPEGFKVPIYEEKNFLSEAHSDYLRHTVSVNSGSRKGLVSILEAGLKRKQWDEMGVVARTKAIMKGEKGDYFPE